MAAAVRAALTAAGINTAAFVPADAADRTALTTRLTTLGRVRHPHLVAVTQVRQEPGAFNVVHARGEAADLTAVLAVRGHVAAGEAAAIGVNVAQAIAALHAAGLVHGPLEPIDIALRSGGEPALRPRPTAPPPEWTPAEDVRALARLVDGVLGSRSAPGTVPAALAGDPVLDPDGAMRGVLEAALGADPRRRPEAGTLAALIDDACEPVPLRLPDPATLAGAALADMLRTPASGQEVSTSRGRRRARTAAGRRRMPTGAVGATGATDPAGGTGARGGTGAPGGRGSRRSPRRTRRTRGVRLGVPSVAWRPALIVVGIGLYVGIISAAALGLYDAKPRNPGAVQAASATPTPIVRLEQPRPVRSGTPPSALTGPSPDAALDPVPDPVLDRGDPATAAVALTQRRLDALSSAPPDARAALDAVDVVGSPAYTADVALLAELAGTRPDGPTVVVVEHEVLDAAPDTATVRLAYVIGGHQQVAADGTRTAVPESAPQTAVLDLVWTDGGWRVTGVS
jgi:hypothetical protein